MPAHLLWPPTCRFLLDRPPSLACLSPSCLGGANPALGFRDPCVTRPGQGEPVLGFLLDWEKGSFLLAGWWDVTWSCQGAVTPTGEAACGRGQQGGKRKV